MRYAALTSSRSCRGIRHLLRGDDPGAVANGCLQQRRNKRKTWSTIATGSCFQPRPAPRPSPGNSSLWAPGGMEWLECCVFVRLPFSSREWLITAALTSTQSPWASRTRTDPHHSSVYTLRGTRATDVTNMNKPQGAEKPCADVMPDVHSYPMTLVRPCLLFLLTDDSQIFSFWQRSPPPLACCVSGCARRGAFSGRHEPESTGVAALIHSLFNCSHDLHDDLWTSVVPLSSEEKDLTHRCGLVFRMVGAMEWNFASVSGSEGWIVRSDNRPEVSTPSIPSNV